MTTTVLGSTQYVEKDVALTTWLALPVSSVGSAEGSARWYQKSVQATGTFDSATLTMQGSNDGSTWATLTTDGSTACTFTAAGVKNVFENTRFIRPSVGTGGASTQAINVYLVGVENE